MKVLTGISQFQTAMQFTGVLPEVPAVGDSTGADLTTLTGYLDQVAQANPADVARRRHLLDRQGTRPGRADRRDRRPAQQHRRPRPRRSTPSAPR